MIRTYDRHYIVLLARHQPVSMRCDTARIGIPSVGCNQRHDAAVNGRHLSSVEITSDTLSKAISHPRIPLSCNGRRSQFGSSTGWSETPSVHIKTSRKTRAARVPRNDIDRGLNFAGRDKKILCKTRPYPDFLLSSEPG